MCRGEKPPPPPSLYNYASQLTICVTVFSHSGASGGTRLAGGHGARRSDGARADDGHLRVGRGGLVADGDVALIGCPSRPLGSFDWPFSPRANRKGLSRRNLSGIAPPPPSLPSEKGENKNGNGLSGKLFCAF